MKSRLTKKEKRLLQELQDNFPLKLTPYREIGRRMGLPEKEVISKISRWIKKDIIRYIGPLANLKKLGMKSTLVAMKVPKKRLDWVVKIINSYPNVSHNYLRDGEYNLWFTLSAASEKRLSYLIKKIKQKTGGYPTLNLAARNIFKLDARFPLNEKKTGFA